MDISKEYIKMCDCPEIREWYEKGWVGHDSKDFIGWRSVEDDTPIPLPRQDQIQEMIPQCNCSVCLTEEFYHFFERNIEGFLEVKIDSMEQLWLAFYMYEKHQLIWDGEKWIKLSK